MLLRHLEAGAKQSKLCSIFVFNLSLGADHQVLTWASAAAVRQWPAQCQRGARSDHNAAMRAPALLHQRL